MTDTDSFDQADRRIIEAAMLGRKLYHMDDGDEEFEQTGLAFEAAVSGLPSGEKMAVMILMKLLDGSPYSITSDNPDNIRLCITLAHAIGATVEDAASGACARF
jgi:hypothetical protein